MMRKLVGCACIWIVTMMPAVSQAQLLDFDGVCAFPPCFVGGLYPGFTFSPGTAQVVSAGTDGLTGPVGGKYLSVPGVAITITASKNVKEIHYKLSRASTSAGPMTVSVAPTKNGVPVLPAMPVQLTTVNTWSASGFGVYTMDIDGIQFTPSTADTFGIDDLRFEAPCFGFVDVQPADTFCNAAEWLGNRNVTLGCAAGQYCPGQNVSRGQMALFMHRLGTALTPVVLQRDCATNSSFAPLQRSCLAGHQALHAKIATAVVTCGITNPTAATKTVTGELVYSSDGGFTWTPMGHPSYASFAGGPAASLANTGSIALATGTSYSFGIEIAHYAGAAAATLSSECTLVVTVHNHNPAISPL